MFYDFTVACHCFAYRAPGNGDDEVGVVRKFGKLTLVDLAGSERLKETGNTDRAAIQETGAINKSLFCLGQVRAGMRTK